MLLLMDPAELTLLKTRLTAVERRLRATRTAWLASVAAFIVLGMGAQQAASQSGILRTRGIEVVDAAGTVRIGFTVHGDAAEVVLSDASGQGRIWFSVKNDGTPSAVLSDSSGVGRVWITAQPERPAGLIFSDGTGRGRVWIGAFNDASTGLVLVDQSGKVIFQAP